MTSTIYYDLVLALTPIQRFQSARQFDSNPTLKIWYLVVATVAVIVLLFAFMLARYQQNEKSEENKKKREFLLYYAQKSGFSGRQCEILYEMTKWPAVKNIGDIFIMPDAFENMAAYAWEQCLKKEGAEAAKLLQFEIQTIKEKLGFDTGPSSVATRRKYMRVSVDRLAIIAEYPFSIKMGSDPVQLKDLNVIKYRPATLTEIAVSAVVVKVKKPIEHGSRVLVMFEHDDLNDNGSGTPVPSVGMGGRKMISHYGKVRRVDQCDKEYNVVVEFLNLASDQIDELIRITGCAAKKMNDTDLADDSGQHVPELAVSGGAV